MARVYNWQIGREMSYWYPDSRPKKQFAAVFDINKCIACQTCTLACKTTWTSGRGQEYMLWNNVESKPYGCYPLAWDLKLLEMINGGDWKGKQYAGQTIFESAPAGERVLGWRPESQDYANPNVGEDDCTGQVDHGASISMPHMNWFFYLARICNHCTYPGCLASCPRGSIYKRPEDGIVLVDQGRCRGYQECVRGCPYKKVFFNALSGTSEKCIACYPKIEQGIQPQCFVNCIGKIRLAGLSPNRSRRVPTTRSITWCTSGKSRCRCSRSSGWSRTSTTFRPSTCPTPFTQQLFGPGVEEAVKTYRNAPNDKDLSSLLCLFGSSEMVMPRWKRQGDSAIGLGENGAPLAQVPLNEPVHIRPAFDKLYQIQRTNCP